MDVERIVVRFMADATQYMRVLNQVESQAVRTAGKLEAMAGRAVANNNRMLKAATMGLMDLRDISKTISQSAVAVDSNRIASGVTQALVSGVSRGLAAARSTISAMFAKEQIIPGWSPRGKHIDYARRGSPLPMILHPDIRDLRLAGKSTRMRFWNTPTGDTALKAWDWAPPISETAQRIRAGFGRRALNWLGTPFNSQFAKDVRWSTRGALQDFGGIARAPFDFFSSGGKSPPMGFAVPTHAPPPVRRAGLGYRFLSSLRDSPFLSMITDTPGALRSIGGSLADTAFGRKVGAYGGDARRIAAAVLGSRTAAALKGSLGSLWRDDFGRGGGAPTSSVPAKLDPKAQARAFMEQIGEKEYTRGEARSIFKMAAEHAGHTGKNASVFVNKAMRDLGATGFGGTRIGRKQLRMGIVDVLDRAYQVDPSMPHGFEKHSSSPPSGGAPSGGSGGRGGGGKGGGGRGFFGFSPGAGPYVGAAGGIAMPLGLAFGLGGALFAAKGLFDMVTGAVTGTIDAIAKFGMNALEWAVDLGIAFEKQQVAFEGLVGSQEGGRKLLHDIKQLAVQSPYRSKELLPVGQMLLGMGVDSEAIVPTLGRLGDIAGGDTQKLHRLALAFGQSHAAGRLMGTELRQFSEAGVGIRDFAETAGMSDAQFRGEMEAGLVSSNVVNRTVNRLTSPGGRFSGMSKRVTGTVGGQWSSFMETLEIAGEQFAVKAFKRLDVADWIRRAADAVRNFDPEKLVDWMERAAHFAESFAAGLGAAGMAAKEMISGLASSKVEDLKAPFSAFVEEAVVGVAELAKTLGMAVLQMSMLVEWAAKLAGVTGKVDEKDIENQDFFSKSFGDFIKRGEVELGNFSAPTLLYNRTVKNVGLDNWDTDWKVKLFDPTAGGPSPGLAKSLADLEKTEPGQKAREAYNKFLAEIQNIRIGKSSGLISSFLKSAVSGRAAEIPIVPRISSGAEKLAMGIMGDMKGGFGAYGAFQNTLSQLNEAYWGPGGAQREFGIGAYEGGWNFGGRNFGGQWVRWGDENPNYRKGSALSGEGREFGMYNAYLSLRSAVADRMEAKLPPALMKGTAEAQDTINRSSQKQLSVMEEVQRVLELSKKIQEEQRDEMKNVVKALDKIKGKKL